MPGEAAYLFGIDEPMPSGEDKRPFWTDLSIDDTPVHVEGILSDATYNWDAPRVAPIVTESGPPLSTSAPAPHGPEFLGGMASHGSSLLSSEDHRSRFPAHSSPPVTTRPTAWPMS